MVENKVFIVHWADSSGMRHNDYDSREDAIEAVQNLVDDNVRIDTIRFFEAVEKSIMVVVGD